MKIDGGAYRNRTDIQGFAEACAPNKLSIDIMIIPIVNSIFVQNNVNTICLGTKIAYK